MAYDPRALTHDHVYLSADHDTLGRRTLVVVILTAVTMAVEIVAGLVTGSMALLADGLHMATHAGALGLSAAAYAYARRRAKDPAFSFGTGKVGDLAGFASALILALVALGVAAESIGRLWLPVEVAYREAAMVAVLGLAVNLASAAILGLGHGHGRGHAHGHSHGGDGHGHNHAHGRGHHDQDHHHDDDHHHARGPADLATARTEHGDTNFRAAFAHVVTDALTSVLAIVALAAGAIWGLRWVDPAIGILGAVLIMLWAIRLLRESSSVLLDLTEPALAEAVRAAVEDNSTARIADLHIWRIGPAGHAAIVSVSGNADCEAIRRRLAAVPGLAHVTVEVRGV